jgi:hypothetical protein
VTYYVLLCEDYMDYRYDLYVLNLNCYYFIVCMRPVLEAPHPERQPKQRLYKKPIYSSVNRGTYDPIFLD